MPGRSVVVRDTDEGQVLLIEHLTGEMHEAAPAELDRGLSSETVSIQFRLLIDQ